MPLLEYLRWIAFTIFLLSSKTAISASFTDSLGNTIELAAPPQRIVTLAYAFTDALAAIDMTPVGIADDHDPQNLHPSVRRQLQHWVSVGTRTAPDLEQIAALKPDLIIGDVNRHQASYATLSQIAPTVMLPSRGETYEENLAVAAQIGTLVGEEARMTARLQQHTEFMQQMALQLTPFNSQRILFAIALESGIYAYSDSAYPGGVLKAVGLQVPESVGADHRALQQLSLNEMTRINPDILLSGDMGETNVLQQWQQDPIWANLNAVKQARIYTVDGNYWAHCRGMLASESMADTLLNTLSAPALMTTSVQ
ncbi:Fe(3+) dicitrate ABC transporter substrate-binding protein [Photobacterium sp. 1_MG-2023]|uniref:ABC transporter substrate-binding protein n=1 Tax=Photobacterium sp. 1_MG-2023 TaxID=3062646 RepID=UPI0026E11DA1|nr:Fe(3+) dicitrate ABC transporter substrate-binding protein [Photobacterium sp. 1_MG-2023]MDO6705079.1 Fe(3+) dicitrate ABC transporter substrate-binding protein [Photobacterium sp. 1_MG-2023]